MKVLLARLKKKFRTAANSALAKLRAAFYFVADKIGDVLLVVFRGMYWICDHPIPFVLTLIAGVLFGAVLCG